MLLTTYKNKINTIYYINDIGTLRQEFWKKQ